MAFALFSTLKTFRLFSPTAVLPLQGTAAVVERSQSPPRAALPEVAPVIAPLPAAERTLPAPEPERRPPAPPSGRWAPSLEPPPPRSCAAGRGWFSWGGTAAAAAAETEGKICFRNDPHWAEKHRFIHFNSIISNLSMSVIINKTRIWCFESITVITNNKKCCFKLKDHISHFLSFFIKSQTVIHENGHGGQCSNIGCFFPRILVKVVHLSCLENIATCLNYPDAQKYVLGFSGSEKSVFPDI